MAETILFAEDSEDDRLMFERALHRLPFKTEVRFANDGHEAISYLEGKDQYSDRQKFPIPTVILFRREDARHKRVRSSGMAQKPESRRVPSNSGGHVQFV